MSAGSALFAEGIAQVLVEGSAEKTTLAPLSRRFEAGKLHVVGGPSGSGKTTLLSILSLTVRASRGMIKWGTQNLTQLKPAAQAQWRRENLGLVFQTSRLVGVMNPAEHIRLAAAIRGRPEAEEEGIAALRALGMGNRLTHLPAQLSGGEKQLCARPAVLLADEPTAALDQTNAALVAHTLRTFARQCNAVVICVSHDRVVMDAADELLILEKA
jgi:putative ABC transport system ATP-binding protein